MSTRFFNQQNTADLVQVVEQRTSHTAAPQEDIPCSQSSLQEEYCPVHPQELFVAHDSSSNKLLCNQCIYNSDVATVEDQMQNLNFTSYIAGSLKDLFDKKFDNYRQSLQQMHQIAPQQITEQLEGTVDKFFTDIESNIKQVEIKVIQKIQMSKNLHELEMLLQEAEQGFGIQSESQYEHARMEIDSFVKSGQYSAVVQKKDVYEVLIQQMAQQNGNMTTAVEQSQKKIMKIMTMKNDQDAQQRIGKRLHEIVDSCLEIDVPSQRQQEAQLKRQRVEQEMELQRQAEVKAKEAAAAKRVQDEQHRQRVIAQQQAEKLRFEEEARIAAAAAAAKQKEVERQEAIRRQQQEQARQQEIARQLQEQRAKEIARQQELQRQQQEQARQQELQRQQEQARQEEQARMEQEAAKRAQEATRLDQLREQERQRQEKLHQEQQEQLQLLQKQKEQQAAQEAERQEKLQKEFEENERLMRAQEEQKRMLDEKLALERQRQLQIRQENEHALEQQRLQQLERQQQAMKLMAERALQDSIQKSEEQRLVEEKEKRERQQAEHLLLHRIHNQNQQRTDQIQQSLLQAADQEMRVSSERQVQQETPRVSSSHQMVSHLSEPNYQNLQIVDDSMMMVSDVAGDEAQEQHHVFDLTQSTSLQAAPAQTTTSANLQEQATFSPVVQFESVQSPQQMSIQSPQQIVPINQHKVVDVIEINERSEEAATAVVQLAQPIHQAPVVINISDTNSNLNQNQDSDLEIIQHNRSSSAQAVQDISRLSTPLISPAQATSGYQSLFKLKQGQAYKSTPLSNNLVQEEIKYTHNGELFGANAVGLPGDRMFVIGGSMYKSGAQAVKDCSEIVNGCKVAKSSMHTARSNFGCAVYPNYSQIFLAGGSVSDELATKSCERYIVKDDQWKRLPELKEAKSNISLCFFNQGSTLYCFGGAYKKDGASQLSRSIERLSKGENSWKILSVQLPEACMDIGALQLPQTQQVMLFGGFTDNLVRNVMFYETAEEGKFVGQAQLEKGDHFKTNGCYVLPSAGVLIFGGQTGYHKFDTHSKTFTSLEVQATQQQ